MAGNSSVAEKVFHHKSAEDEEGICNGRVLSGCVGHVFTSSKGCGAMMSLGGAMCTLSPHAHRLTKAAILTSI